MQFFDTHCHLDFKDFETCLSEVLSIAKNEGVQKIFVPGIDGEIRNSFWRKGLKECLPGWGIHPMYAGKWQKNDIRKSLNDSCSRMKIHGVGECGLDKRLEISLEKQLSVFRIQAEIAFEMKLPLIVHLIGHWQEALEIKRRLGPGAIWIMHAFCGTGDVAREFSEIGAFISFSGNLLRPNAKKVLVAARNVLSEKLLIETDSPGMVPAGCKDTFNSPKNLLYVFNFLAKLRQMDFKEFSEVLWENSLRAFNLSGQESNG